MTLTAYTESAREILSRREIDRVVYFHTDHYEPWRSHQLASKEAFARNIEGLYIYADRMAKLRHARRLTHFYLPGLTLTDEDRSDAIRVKGDSIGILLRNEAVEREIAEAFAHMSKVSTPEYQVHFHHEYLTWNNKYAPESRLGSYFAENDVSLNRKRFDMGLAETLSRIRKDTGAPLAQWHFVHGMWSLNASDQDVCTITDEIARLMAQGGVGDFTFPAGRVHCDPRFDQPAFVKPVTAPKGYDTPKADPQLSGLESIQDRFFIWSSRTKTSDASIDFFSPEVARKLENVDLWLEKLLNGAFQLGSTLYLKTHAHSMNNFYFYSGGGVEGQCLFPHEYDGFKRLIDTVEEAIGSRGGTLEFKTAAEVYDEFAAHAVASTKAEVIAGFHGVPAPFNPDALQKADKLLVSTLSKRLAKMGTTESGLFDHYAGIVSTGKVIRAYEETILTTVQRFVPKEMPITNIIAAVGSISAALAMDGRDVRAVEPSAKRFGALDEVLTAVQRKTPGAASRVVAKNLLIPGNEDIAGRCVLLTDSTLTLSDEQFDAVIESLRAASLILIDGLRFFRRLKADDMPDLAERLAAKGWGPAQLVNDWADGAQLLLFKPQNQ